jgi:ABC-type protease/lipase transport system fused ATPase/permease subunit
LRRTFVSLACFSGVINLLMLTPAVYMLQVYDRALVSSNVTTLLMLTLLVVGLYVLMGLLEMVRSTVLIRVGNRLDMMLNKRVFTAAFERNLNRAGGNPAQALQDMAQVRQFLTGNGLFAFFDSPWTPIYLLVIYLVHPLLGLITLIGSLLLICLAYLTEVSTRKPLAEANQASGKSTLARLLVGVWPAHAGKVRLDGADIFQWNKEELGPWLGYLPQDVELLEGTVAESISRFGEIDGDAVILAAQQAGVHEMILRLPQGYDTPLSADGNSLSGGQKQRVGLARALYGDPSLIVLDEPNASLDDVGEAALVKALADLKQRGKTLVPISHRPTVLNIADKILVLREGTAHMFGSRDEVFNALRQAAVMPTSMGGATLSSVKTKE